MLFSDEIDSGYGLADIYHPEKQTICCLPKADPPVGRSWTHLSEDLLLIIFALLPRQVLLQRIITVCKSWSTVAQYLLARTANVRCVSSFLNQLSNPLRRDHSYIKDRPLLLRSVVLHPKVFPVIHLEFLESMTDDANLCELIPSQSNEGLVLDWLQKVGCIDIQTAIRYFFRLHSLSVCNQSWDLFCLFLSVFSGLKSLRVEGNFSTQPEKSPLSCRHIAGISKTLQRLENLITNIRFPFWGSFILKFINPQLQHLELSANGLPAFRPKEMRILLERLNSVRSLKLILNYFLEIDHLSSPFIESLDISCSTIWSGELDTRPLFSNTRCWSKLRIIILRKQSFQNTDFGHIYALFPWLRTLSALKCLSIDTQLSDWNICLSTQQLFTLTALKICIPHRQESILLRSMRELSQKAPNLKYLYLVYSTNYSLGKFLELLASEGILFPRVKSLCIETRTNPFSHDLQKLNLSAFLALSFVFVDALFSDFRFEQHQLVNTVACFARLDWDVCGRLIPTVDHA